MTCYRPGAPLGVLELRTQRCSTSSCSSVISVTAWATRRPFVVIAEDRVTGLPVLAVVSRLMMKSTRIAAPRGRWGSWKSPVFTDGSGREIPEGRLLFFGGRSR